MNADTIKEPEVCLWREVILQAFMDATDEIDPATVHAIESTRGMGLAPEERCQQRRRVMTMTKRRLALSERDQARSWLTGGTEDFFQVCNLALVEPTAVLRSARNLATRNWKARSNMNGAGTNFT